MSVLEDSKVEGDLVDISHETVHIIPADDEIKTCTVEFRTRQPGLKRQMVEAGVQRTYKGGRMLCVDYVGKQFPRCFPAEPALGFTAFAQSFPFPCKYLLCPASSFPSPPRQRIPIPFSKTIAQPLQTHPILIQSNCQVLLGQRHCLHQPTYTRAGRQCPMPVLMVSYGMQSTTPAGLCTTCPAPHSSWQMEPFRSLPQLNSITHHSFVGGPA